MMKFRFSALLTALGIAAASAETSPIYVNNSPVTVFDVPPQVDADAFLNRSFFDVVTLLPWQGQNVRFWTNNGVMSGTPGFIFEYDTDGRTLKKKRRSVRNSTALQLPSIVFENVGSITGTERISINASNIFNPGRLEGHEEGFIRITSTNGFADLSRGGIRVGPATDPSFNCGFFSVGTNYTADQNIVERYWGAGRNNDLGTNGAPLNLPLINNGLGLNGNFSLPFPNSPLHEVISRSGRFLLTNLVSIPGSSFIGGNFFGGCGGLYEAFVHTNANTATSSVVTVVFVATNNLVAQSNLFVDVRFRPNSGPAGLAYAPVVEFRNVDFDIVRQQFLTNYVTFVDASGAQTNIVLGRPTTVIGGGTVPGTRRPNTYTWIRGRLCNTDLFFSETNNAPFDPGMFYSPLFQTNIANTIYAAHSVHIGRTNLDAFSRLITVGGRVTQLGVNPGLSDPTNFTGNVSINARELNLASTRIRAEEFIGIRTDNLISNDFAQLDAPFIDFDVRSTNGQLIIRDIAPASVSRLRGDISAWSSVWSVNVTNANSGALNSIRYHVVIIDNCLRPDQAVTIHRFAAQAPSLVIEDPLFVNSGIRLDTQNLTVQSNGSINVPAPSNLAFTNVLDLLNFTNFGSVNVPGAAYFGTFQAGHVATNIPPKRKKKRRREPVIEIPAALDNFVNHGTMSGASIFVRATNAEITGRAVAPATMLGNGGVVAINGLNTFVSNTTIIASSDVEFHAENLTLSSTFISAGIISNTFGQYIRGSLIIDATNSFGDPVEAVTTNDWFVTGGVRIPTLPFERVGDLLGTRVYSAAGPLVSSTHVWPAEDRGPVVDGYFNNLALGRLVLDGRGGNLFRFSAAPGFESNALYVEYLELLNDATNFNFAVGVDSNFTIYFADSNFSPEVLDPSVEDPNLPPGRLRWVSSFAGAQSSTNITYPSGVTHRFNAGLVRSLGIDSDGDGIVNGLDCTPIQVPELDAATVNCPVPPLPPTTSAAMAKAAAISSSDISLTIALSPSGGQVALSWDAPAGSGNVVEYADHLGGSWSTLTNFVAGPASARVTINDEVSVQQRVYRVRVDGVGK